MDEPASHPSKQARLTDSFYPVFASPDGKANISTIADHAEYIANRIGRSQ